MMDNRSDLENNLTSALNLVHTIQECENCKYKKQYAGLELALNGMSDLYEEVAQERNELKARCDELIHRLKERE